MHRAEKQAAVYLTLAISLLMSASPLRAQNVASPEIHRDISVIRQEDMSDHPEQDSPEAITAFEHRGERRVREVRVLMNSGELKTSEDLYKAAFVLQHGLTAEDYLLAHVLATDSLLKGNADAKWLVASTLDRYLQLIQKQQIFGTQYPLDPTKPHPYNADQHARFMGRMQDPFNRSFLPDSVRADFCVPPLAQHQLNLKSLNSDKYPDEDMVLPGCKR